MFLLDVVFIWLWFFPSYRIVLSQLWSPCTVKDSTTLEAIQHRASKYILSTSTISYRDRLIQLRLLPLFYWLDLQDLLFLVKCFLFPPDNFDIFSYVSFCKPGSRSGTSGKLFFPLIGCHHLATFISRGWFGCGISCYL